MVFRSRFLRGLSRSHVYWLSWAVVLIACVYVGRIHLFFWQHAGAIGSDDAYTMSVGERLISGHWLPYVDGSSHRGPLLYWVAAVSQVLTGRYGWHGARLLSMVTTYGTLLGVFAVGRVARRPLAGALAALFYAWSVLTVLVPSPAYAVTGEGLMAPLCVLSILFAARALLRTVAARRRAMWLAVAGVFAALAGLAKQTAVPLAAPLGLWILAHLWSTPAITPRERVRSLAAFIGGFFLPLTAVVLLYAVIGELRTFWYWWYVYNAEVYMSAYRDVSFVDAFTGFLYERPWAVGAFFMSVSCSLVRPLGFMRASVRGMLRGYAAVGLESTTAWIALAMFVAAVAPMRFWPHYFLGVFPFVGLVIGIQAERLLLERGNPRNATLPALAFLALVVALGAFWADRRHESLLFDASTGRWSTHQDEQTCQIIDSYSQPDDSLFVWGFSPDLYLSCRRKPASRYVFLTLVAGIVPPQWTTVREDRVARGARENLLADLDSEQPPVIVDAPAPMGHVSMLSVPQIGEYLPANYCNRGTLNLTYGGQATLWVRRDLPACSLPPPAGAATVAPAGPPPP